MMRSTLLGSFGLAVLAMGSLAAGQAPPPFFGGGVVAYDPEISVVNSGALLDAQVVVSDDRRYVTINARPSLSRLQSLTVFPFSGVGQANGGGGGGGGGGGPVVQGFVGGAGFLAEADYGAAADTPAPRSGPPTAVRDHAAGRTNQPTGPTSHVPTSPTELLKIDTTAADSILRQEGMFLLTAN